MARRLPFFSFPGACVRMAVVKKIKILVLLSFVSFGILGLTADSRLVRSVASYSAGPPPAYTGAPGESSCLECHTGGAGAGTFVIIAPPAYVPGTTYQLTVRHINPNPTRKR